MNETTVLPAPVLDLGPKNKWEQERAAFRELLPDLLATYRDKYVAIHEGKVVGVGDDLIPVALQAYKEYGYIPIYVDRVCVEPRVARLASPRLVRNERVS